MKTKFYKITLICMLFACVLNLQAQQLAFPGAEGFGAYATGGRGGAVVHVTNLNESGPGSFADAVSSPNRIVVFDVSGVIKISPATIIMVASNITVAGQTAPGDGITIYGNRVVTNGTNVILRYLRMRGSINMASDKCAVTIDNASNIIYDHCSISWGRWDNIHITNSTNITFQYCMIGEGIDPQRFGAITDGTRNWTVHHCLWIDNKSRNPKMKCFLQYINNVVYNYGCCGIVGGHSAADNYQDVMNNYFIAGPSSGDGSGYLSDWTPTDHLYSSGNYIDLDKDGTLNGTPMTSYAGATVQTSPYLTSPTTTTMQSAADAYATVLSSAGASIVRDTTDTRLIAQLTSLGTTGTNIASEADVKGPGLLFSAPPRVDTDNDGMPDDWEIAHGLNPNDPSDANGDRDGDGWTNIEEYINSITTPVTFLRCPAYVVATPYSENRIDLKWSDYSSTEDGFVIERSLDNNVFTPIITLGPNVTSYSDNGLTRNVTYYYRIKSYNATQTSVYCAVVSAKTMSDAPQNPTPANNATYVNPVSVVFTWTTNLSVTSCKFYMGTDPASLVYVGDATGNTYTVTNLNNSKQYYWRVDAISSSGTNTGDVWTFTTKTAFPLGMVAYWKMNDNSDYIADSSGYANDGNLVNMDNPVWEPGINGGCLNFKNSITNSNVSVPHADPLYFDKNPFTISLWMKAPSTQGECYLIHKGDFKAAGGVQITGKWFGIQLKSPNITFGVDDDITKTALNFSYTTFLTNQWVHVVAVRDTLTKKLRLYRNATEVANTTDNTKTTIGQVEPLYLGNSCDLNVPYLGSLDDVRIYNYALSPTEITNLYNSSVPVPGVAVNPHPADGNTYADVNMPVLSWTAGSAASTFDVYVGTSSSDLQKVSADQSLTSYKIMQLLPNSTIYYWRIDSKNIKGITTGDLWSFATKKSFPNGIVGNWKLDEATGITATDSSVYHNDGTIMKLTNPQHEPGHILNCINFSNGRDSSHIAVPFADQLYFDKSPLTISCWMKISSSPATSVYLIHKGSFVNDPLKGTNGKWFGIEVKGAALNFSVDDDATKTLLTTTSAEFCTGQWIHLVAIRDTATKLLKLYRNGTLVTSIADKTGSIENFEKIYIANDRDLNAPFLGALDEVKLFNYALNDQEIQQLYNEDALINKPYNLSPADLSQNIDSLNMNLSWSGDANTRYYNIYFGMSANALSQQATNVTTTSYRLTGLQLNTQYFWRVDACNNTYIIPGDIVSFTTKKIGNTGLHDLKVSGINVYPNPFTQNIGIQFMLTSKEKVLFQITSLSGKLIATLVDKVLPEGNQMIFWNGKDSNNQLVDEGMYLLIMQTSKSREVKKIIYMKK